MFLAWYSILIWFFEIQHQLCYAVTFITLASLFKCRYKTILSTFSCITREELFTDCDRDFKSCSVVQAVFASCIPEILELVGTRPKYGGEFRREHGKRYPVSVAAVTTFRLLNVVDCLNVTLISPLLLFLFLLLSYHLYGVGFQNSLLGYTKQCKMTVIVNQKN